MAKPSSRRNLCLTEVRVSQATVHRRLLPAARMLFVGLAADEIPVGLRRRRRIVQLLRLRLLMRR